MFRAKFLLTGFLMVLVLFLTPGIGSGGAGSPPEITYVDFPKEINADGTPVQGTVFRASNGDLLKAIFTVVEAVDFQPFEVDLTSFQGQIEGEFSFEISTMTPQKVTLNLTLLDQEGNASPSVFFTFEAIQACQSWSRTFGGSENDWGYSGQQTSDGGYILFGTTRSYGAGEYDFWLIKTDSEGNKQWERTFGGSDIDWGWSVQQTKDGGYILLGYTESYGTGKEDFWLIKTDAYGNKEWDRTFGGSESDWGSSVQQTKDGGYILLGYTESYGTGKEDFWLIKTDSQGNKEWDRTFGGSEADWGTSVQQTADGGYILLGDTVSYGAGSADFWLIKTDSQGNKQWAKTFGGSETEWGSSVQQTEDGGYILLGGTASYGAGGLDFWLIKYCPEE